MMRVAFLIVACATILKATNAFSITTSVQDIVNRSYDYIVVGGGTAGLVVARRLAESASSISVLVVEAGFDTRTNENISTAGSLYGRWRDTTNLSYIYESQPQPFKKYHEQIHHPLGRGLGGSSTINGLLWDGPQAEQIDAWRELNKDSDAAWGWLDLLPAFNRSQHFNAPQGRAKALGATADVAQHNAAGPVDVSFLGSSFAPAFTAVRQAIKDVFGFPQVLDSALGKDLNGFQYNAIYIYPDAGTTSNDASATSNFVRVSSATAYLDLPADQLPNLTLLTNWSTVNVTTEGTTSAVRASGVVIQQERNGITHRLKAKREVILCAGAVKSPVLLELSGIGDPDILKRLGVSTVLDLKGVGRNLMEHPSLTMRAPIRDNQTSIEQFGPMPAYAMLPAASVLSNATEMQAYADKNVPQWAQRSVDLGGAVNVQGVQRQYELISRGIFTQSWPVAEYQFFAHKTDKDFSFGVVLLNPFTRGSVHALSRDAIWSTKQVNVSSIFYAQDFDVEMHIANCRAGRRIFQAPIMSQDVLAGMETVPGYDKVPDVAESSLDSSKGRAQYGAWSDFVTTNGSPFNHLMGTCAMMSHELGGVVDSNFRVYGTSNLRVVDASIIPMQISAHTSGTLYGVAELAAERIIKG